MAEVLRMWNIFFLKSTGDTEHLLLHCHSYDACRRDLLVGMNSTLQQYGFAKSLKCCTAKIILFGDKRLPVDSNLENLKVTLRYGVQHNRIKRCY